jgi:hypothetical protein
MDPMGFTTSQMSTAPSSLGQKILTAFARPMQEHVAATVGTKEDGKKTEV